VFPIAQRRQPGSAIVALADWITHAAPEDRMKALWTIVAAVALVALAGPGSAQDKVKQDAVKTKNAVVKGATVTADKTKEGVSKTGEVITDAWITTRVHEQFINADALKDSQISVDTDKHIVTLTGTVTSSAGREKANSIAKHTEGVHRVVNRLTIGPHKG
jgi:hyperosmotically inducible protein